METGFTARRRLAIVLALCLSAFLISVDVTIVNVALPTLVRSLGATTTQLQWVVDAYSLVFAALVLAAGSLSDRQGWKGTLLIGLGVFAAASLAGALVNTTTELIAARASLHGGCVVAGGVVIAGAIMAGLFLPARPGREPQAQPPSPSGDPSLQAHAAEPAP